MSKCDDTPTTSSGPDQRRLGGILLGNSEAPDARGIEAPGHGEHHRDGTHRPVESELADEGEPIEAQRRIVEAEDRHGDGEVERWLFSSWDC